MKKCIQYVFRWDNIYEMDEKKDDTIMQMY